LDSNLRYLLLASGCVGALTGAGSAWLVAQQVVSSPDSSRESAAARTEAADDKAPTSEQVASRLQELERRVASIQSLQDRLVMRQRAESMARESSTQGIPPGSSSVDVADPVFEAAVADIIDRDIERRRTERQEQRQQRRQEELQRSTKRLSGTLGLSPQQESEITQLLTNHWDKLSEVRDDSNPNSTREERRKKADALIKSTDEQLTRILNPEQAAAYRALPAKEKAKLGGRPDREERPPGAGNPAPK
jgi:hypothetical protein